MLFSQNDNPIVNENYCLLSEKWRVQCMAGCAQWSVQTWFSRRGFVGVQLNYYYYFRFLQVHNLKCFIDFLDRICSYSGIKQQKLVYISLTVQNLLQIGEERMIHCVEVIKWVGGEGQLMIELSQRQGAGYPIIWIVFQDFVGLFRVKLY